MISTLSANGLVLAVSTLGYKTSTGAARVYLWDPSAPGAWSTRGGLYDMVGAGTQAQFGHSLSLNNEGTK